MYTNLFYLAANPTFIYKTLSEDNLDVDHSVPGKAIRLKPNEDFAQLQKEVINKDMLVGLDIAKDMMERSTIYDQALGGIGDLGANAAFSTVSLLHQAGRLSLTSPQKRGSWGISGIMEIIMDIISHNGKKGSVRTMNRGLVEFEKGDIPESLIIEANLEIDLPQDMLQQTNIANMVVQSGLASRRWTRENVLNIAQSDKMDEEVWTEQTAEQLKQMIVSNLMQMDFMNKVRGQGEPQAPQGPGMNAQAGLIPGANPGEQPMPPNMTGEA